MTRILIITLLSLFLGGTAAAGERFVCTQGPQKRVISVVHPGDGALPCQVRYDKGSEEPRVLWSAENTKGYCASKAKQFARKQEQAFGYDCSRRQAGKENSANSSS